MNQFQVETLNYDIKILNSININNKIKNYEKHQFDFDCVSKRVFSKYKIQQEEKTLNGKSTKKWNCSIENFQKKRKEKL